MRHRVPADRPVRRPLSRKPSALLMGRGEGGRPGTALAAADVLLELTPELADGGLHRPARPVGQPADRRARHDADLVADLLQDGQVLLAPLAAADAVHDLEHPAGALAAR